MAISMFFYGKRRPERDSPIAKRKVTDCESVLKAVGTRHLHLDMVSYSESFSVLVLHAHDACSPDNIKCFNFSFAARSGISR